MQFKWKAVVKFFSFIVIIYSGEYLNQIDDQLVPIETNWGHLWSQTVIWGQKDFSQLTPFDPIWYQVISHMLSEGKFGMCRTIWLIFTQIDQISSKVVIYWLVFIKIGIWLLVIPKNPTLFLKFQKKRIPKFQKFQFFWYLLTKN